MSLFIARSSTGALQRQKTIWDSLHLGSFEMKEGKKVGKEQ